MSNWAADGNWAPPPWRCGWPEAGDVERIRSGLKDPQVGIHMHCFNKAEVDEIAAQLTPEERQRVRFFWMVFGGGKK